jgi:hypothetical protein
VVRRWISLLLVLLSLPTIAQAQTTYNGLTPTIYASSADRGNGSGTSEANAMDLPTALASACGNIIGVLDFDIAGLYQAAVINATTPVFRVTNSCSSGSQITVVCKYPALDIALAVGVANVGSDGRRCQFDVTGETAGSGATSSAIGVDTGGHSYINLIGMFVNEATSASSPNGGLIRLAQGDHLTLTRAVLWQNSTSGATNDNFSAMVMTDCDDCRVWNNWFHGGGSDSLNHNVASITLYNAKRVLIENNKATDINSFLFTKGSNTDGGETEFYNDGTARYNWIDNANNAAFTIAEINASRGFDYTQNIILNSGACFDLSDTGGQHHHARIRNNTCVDATAWAGASAGIMGSFAFTSTEIVNNIVAWTTTTALKALDFETTITATATINYNNYFETGATVQFHQAGTTYTGLTGTPNWRTDTSDDAQSITTDPQFQNAAAGNYKLQPGSPALTAGDTGGPVGAYITGNETIGLTSTTTTSAVRLRFHALRAKPLPAWFGRRAAA